jgi:TRAP-type C4-dicarboxylate transport system permease large subunit
MVGVAESKLAILLLINVALLAVGDVHGHDAGGADPHADLPSRRHRARCRSGAFRDHHVLNLCIGLCTPPVGTVLFVGVGVARTTIAGVLRPLLPL